MSHRHQQVDSVPAPWLARDGRRSTATADAADDRLAHDRSDATSSRSNPSPWSRTNTSTCDGPRPRGRAKQAGGPCTTALTSASRVACSSASVSASGARSPTTTESIATGSPEGSGAGSSTSATISRSAPRQPRSLRGLRRRKPLRTSSATLHRGPGQVPRGRPLRRRTTQSPSLSTEWLDDRPRCPPARGSASPPRIPSCTGTAHSTRRSNCNEPSTCGRTHHTSVVSTGDAPSKSPPQRPAGSPSALAAGSRPCPPARDVRFSGWGPAIVEEWATTVRGAARLVRARRPANSLLQSDDDDRRLRRDRAQHPRVSFAR